MFKVRRCSPVVFVFCVAEIEEKQVSFYVAETEEKQARPAHHLEDKREGYERIREKDKRRIREKNKREVLHNIWKIKEKEQKEQETSEGYKSLRAAVAKLELTCTSVCN